MNSVDIRALVADCQSHTHIQDWHARHLIAAIESLLAERDRLAAENAELRKNQATLSISAVYWPKDGKAELTWEDTESGNRCEITVPVTKRQGEKLSEVVWPCVYYGARTATNASDYAALEAMLADEVAENVRLRSREVGDEVGNLLQEVADLKNELARVKDESLRVVEVENYGNLYNWYMTPTGLGYPGKDRKNNNCIESAEGYYRLDECRPVRLERWEDEG